MLRVINQERAKSNILDNLGKHQCLIVMEWAMKWLPKRFRETQSEWFEIVLFTCMMLGAYTGPHF